MSELFLLGLTGSIGMGKTTTAEMFRDANIAVWDADAAVHELYTSDTDTIEKIYDIAPAAVSGEGVDRQKLGNILQADKDLFPKIEAIVHPAIREHRAAVLVVTTDADTQRERVLSRPGMTQNVFDMISARQTPDAEKRKLADYVIETKTLDHVRTEVHSLIVKLIGALPDA